MFNSQKKEIELHLHFDGAWRPETIFRFAQKKGMSLPCSNPEEFAKHLLVTQPNSLCSFLSKFDYILPPIAGDKEALHQIGLDFIEDCVNRGGHCYVEPRFCPFFFIGDKLSVEEATATVLRSFEKAAFHHNLQWRAILCMMRQNPEWSEQIVDLALANRKNGVVAVDVAGDDKPCDGKNTDARIKAAFKRAHEAGLHCIAHAGENGCAASVTEAVNEMFAERIGHGYHILDDAQVYKEMREKNVHFEVCPLSSQLTGSVVSNWMEHPIIHFEKDSVNYSISTDDPTVTGQWLLAEKRMLACNRVLDMDQFYNANIRAAKACFLEDDAKTQLIKHLEETKDNF